MTQLTNLTSDDVFRLWKVSAQFTTNLRYTTPRKKVSLCHHSSMDRMKVSGTFDLGSNPSGDTIDFLYLILYCDHGNMTMVIN